MILFGLKENLFWITFAGFLFFMCLPFANTCLDILVRQNIPNEAQGRAWGMIGLISQMGYVLANSIVGVLADYVFDPALREGGICMCVLAPCIYCSGKIRALESI